MADFDASDLMALCEGILEDGELSGREVYRLSQWLNANGDACLHWPGKVLVEPLKGAWIDGELSTAELQEIGRLLLRIHTKWTERHRGENLDPVPDLPQGLFDQIDLSRPSLPQIPWITRIPSGRPSAMFVVDLSAPTCTCPDWQTNRSSLPLAHLSRCCSHILSAYGRLKPTQGWPGWMRAFLAHRWTPHPLKHWIVVDVEGARVLASTAPVNWADVFAPDGSEYERFGYHLTDDRWAYDSKPAGSELVRRRIIAATRAAAVDPHAVRRVRIRLPATLLRNYSSL